MKETYSVAETAKLLKYSKNSVYSFLKSGEIKSSRLGKGKFRIPQEEIDRLLVEKPDEKIAHTPVYIPKPRPGRSLVELQSDKPLRTILLWLQERAGLPRLFDWFVALSSIVLGISLFLYTKQLDSLLVGRFALWFTPIKIALFAGGFGLILADMLADQHYLFKNFNNIFRYILVATFLGLAFLELPSRDIDGFLINGLFALVILVEALFGVLSSTAYMFYVQGLLIGIALILRFYPKDTGLSPLTLTVQNAAAGSSSIFGLLALLIICLTLYGYFWNKKVLKAVLGISGLALVALSVYYANVGYYARSFFILITGMIGMLLPFWDEFKRRYEFDRTLVYRMFGTVLMAFSLAVLIIGSVQTILINNSMRSLLEKADLVSVSVESDVANAVSTLDGVTQNSVFTRAFVTRNIDDLESFLKAMFKNNSSFNNVAVADLSGKVLTVYPTSTELAGVDFSSHKFFMETVASGEGYVSTKVEYFAPDIENAIIVAIPIIDSQTGKALGVAMVTLSAEYLTDSMQRIAEGSVGQVITIVDNDGKWIVYPENGAIGTAVSEADATFDLWKKDVGQAKGYDRLGRYSLFASEKSEILAWSVVVSQPMATALDVSKGGLILVLFLLMMAALTVVFSYVFSKGRSYLLEKGV